MENVETAVARYVIDPRSSRLTVRALATGMLSVFGHNPTVGVREVTGDARFTPGTFDAASLHVRIKTASLAVEGDANEKDRREMQATMEGEVLDATRYPEITFDSTSVKASPIFTGRYRVDLKGRLSLHGVTRGLAFQAQMTLSEETLRASGEFSLQQSHHGIKRVSVAGGALKLKDELKFSFDIVARRTEDGSR